jgi:hypothetical protein
MLHETGCGSIPLDTTNTIHIFPMTEKTGVRQISAGDPKDIVQPAHGEAFSLAHQFTNEDSAKRQVSPKGNMPQPRCASLDFCFEYGSPISPRMLLSTDSSSEKMYSDLVLTSSAEEKALSNHQKQTLTALSQDWKGIGRDTAYFMGYQIVVAGTLYLLPESVTKWTDEQKRTTVNKWAENVQSATWDNDVWWINYIGHPYFGATYYIRARERGFGDLGSFAYSALLSALYEYGIEAFFERPSYQDLIVTPVGGLLIGKFIFEPIRASIKSKTELSWFDHLLLILTDPLGAANNVVDRSLGIKSNIRLTVPGLTPLQPDRLLYHTAGSPKRQDENSSRQHGFGVGFNLVW